MSNDNDFEYMEPVVDAICKSLEENPEDWIGYAFSKGYCDLSCVNGDFEGYRLTGSDGRKLLYVSKEGIAINSTTFSSEQCYRIRRVVSGSQSSCREQP